MARNLKQFPIKGKSEKDYFLIERVGSKQTKIAIYSQYGFQGTKLVDNDKVQGMTDEAVDLSEHKK